MKKIKRLSALILTLVLMLALTSCSVMETEQGDVIKAYCESMLDAILADDAEAAFEVLAAETDKDSFLSAFAQMREYIAGVETYELVQKGWYAGVRNGVSYYEATFEMTTNADVYYIKGMTVEGYDGLYSFNIFAAEESSAAFTGTLTTLAGSNPVQWGMLALSAGFLVFAVFMLVDCCKRKIKLKALWIILIIAGALAFTLSSTDGSFSINANIGLFFAQYSHLKLYSTGDFVFRLVLPAGAMIYFFLRKNLPLKEQTPPVQQPVYYTVPVQPQAGQPVDENKAE